MPIPAFDGILNVLPPHLGDPTKPSDLSPYSCSVAEVCDRFDTTPKRSTILQGWLRLRAEFFTLDIAGFQWLGGSFLEDIETQESRDPGDIDVVTFVASPADLRAVEAKLSPRKDLLARLQVKATFHVDHFIVPLSSAPIRVVDLSRYWYGLFSHRRDRVWKGMLHVDLTDKAADDAALATLGGAP